MSEDVLQRSTFVDVDGASTVQVGNFAAPNPPPPPPPPPPVGDSYATYADRVVTILPGDDIDTKIQSTAAGNVIGFAAGVHLIDTAGKQFAPRNGEKLVGATDAGGVPLAILRGNWNQTQTGTGIVSPFSYTSHAAYASNVQFLRLMVERFAPAAQTAVMDAGNNWRFQKCWIHDNKNEGVSIGSGSVLYGCKIYRNASLGLACVAGCVAGVVDSCEVYDNNFQGWHEAGSATGESGGMKFIGVGNPPRDMVVRNSHYHHNDGGGIWIDDAGDPGVGGGHIIEDNVSEYNTYPGIWLEITEGWAAIRRNVSRYNGSEAEIYLSNARGVSGNPIIVEDNQIFSQSGLGVGTNYGLGLLDNANRTPRLGHITVRNNTIHRGIIAGKPNRAINHSNYGGGTIPPGITITGNHYYTDNSQAWQWRDVARTWLQWQAQGFDLTGTTQPF